MHQHEQESSAAEGVPGDGQSYETCQADPAALRVTDAGPPTARVSDDVLQLVAALNAGRLLNRLRFHLEQAWFGYGHHQRAARRTSGALGRAVRNLVPAADRRILQEAVLRPWEDLLNQIESEGHYLVFEGWVGEYADEQLTDEDFR